MEAQIKLGRIFGVEIGLHYTWLIIALLITLSLAGHFQMANPQWGRGVIWTSAVVTGLLFFAAIIAHELSHAAVARARGLPVKSITLFALGGVALLVINTDKAASRTLSIPVAGERHTLSSSDLQSKTVQLNGAELRLGAGDELPVLAGVPIPAGNVEFAPATITFIALPQAGNGACR